MPDRGVLDVISAWETLGLVQSAWIELAGRSVVRPRSDVHVKHAIEVGPSVPTRMMDGIEHLAHEESPIANYVYKRLGAFQDASSFTEVGHLTWATDCVPATDAQGAGCESAGQWWICQ
jgi:hypothetical protein